MHEQQAQRGFTIVELMIVVAIIAVLAVVVIPSFIKESRRASYQSEVHPMFAELGTREEQRKTELGAYLEAAACPPSASATGTDMTTAACATTAGQPWMDLRVQPSETKLKCSYAIYIGDAGANPTATNWPSWVPTTIAPASPATTWYFITATCPSNSYFTSSFDAKIRSEDGH